MWDPRVHVGVAAIIIDPSTDRILVIQRGDGVPHGAGEWSLPGGWIDNGEWPEEAARRELMEEVGVNAVSPKLRGAVSNVFFPPIDTAVTLFYQFKWNDEIKPVNREPDKIQAVTWMTPKALESMDLFAPLESFANERFGWDACFSS